MNKTINIYETNNISIFLIALVVLCPFQCVFGVCSASGLGDGKSACSNCGSCTQPVDDFEPPSPNSPADCPCGDCLCGGALTIDDEFSELVTAGFISFFTSWARLEIVPVDLRTPQVQRSIAVFPADTTAIDVCAALCCWVI